MRASLMLAIIGVLLVGIIPVNSFAASKSDRIRFSYEAPENPAHLERRQPQGSNVTTQLIAGTAYAYLHEAVSGDSPSRSKALIQR